MIIEKEFSIFGNDELGGVTKKDKNYQEKQQLENSLKILKVLNFLCRNANIISSQGIQFLVGTLQSGDDLFTSEGLLDLDL